MIVGKTLLDYTNLFSLNDYQKNGKIIYVYFKDKSHKRTFTPKRIRNNLLEEAKHNSLMSEKIKSCIGL